MAAGSSFPGDFVRASFAVALRNIDEVDMVATVRMGPAAPVRGRPFDF
jgi:hypothetical protein